MIESSFFRVERFDCEDGFNHVFSLYFLFLQKFWKIMSKFD